MFREHELIILTEDIAEEGLEAGDVGTIIHIHRKGAAFEVEFQAVDGHTVAIATVLASQLRPVSSRDVSHARPMELVS
ncbi:MAG: DUF4926 domain-containing protein [Chloroflexi bacterium]|nr:DUF4926 domain-containing protein [Chloroflexota bacterium]